MTARIGLALGLLLPLFGCTSFPVIEADVCGNAVIEKDEDCDTFAEDGRECRPPGIVGACHFDCRTKSDGTRAECPTGMGCAADGLCRAPTGNFKSELPFAPGVSSWLGAADFDGDGRLDVISTEAADEFQQARFRVHYFDADAKLEETRTFPRVVTRPVARQLTSGDAADDLLFSNGLIGMVPGRADREWIPAAFSSYVLPGTRLRAVPVRADGVGEAIGLAIFSDLDEGPGVYVPALDDFTLALRAPLALPFEDLAGAPIAADLVTGVDSPCSEVVYAFWGDDAVHVLDLCGIGTEPFTKEVEWRDEAIEQVVHLPAGATVSSAPQVADVDSDGQLDIIVGAGDQTFVARGQGGKLEEEASVLMLRSSKDGSLFAVAPPLASGDLTGDGVIDFVLPIGILASYTSLVDGRLGYFEGYKNLAKPWSMAIMTDLNGNGLPDVIAGTEGSPGLSFLSGTGGPFQNYTRLSTQGPVSFLTTGDFDGDRVFDVAYIQSGPSNSKDDSLAVAFGQRDAFPEAERRVAQVVGVQQLGSAFQQGGSSLFTVSREKTDGVTRSTFTLFDGSPDRLPFAPYALVTFSVDGSLNDSRARVLTAGAFTAPHANDLFALGGEDDEAAVWSMWLVPDVGGSEKPPQRLQADVLPPDAVAVTINELGGQLSGTAAAADLEGDGFDEVLLLMPKGLPGEGCYLMIFDLDAAASSATSKGILTFDQTCPAPELSTADLNGDDRPDLLVLIGDARIEQRQLRVLFNDQQGGFSLENSVLIGVEGHDVRGVSVFTKAPRRLAFVTDDGLYEAKLNSRSGVVEVTTRRLQGFIDARSVVVTDPDGDGVEDVVVADAAGVSLVRAQFR